MPTRRVDIASSAVTKVRWKPARGHGRTKAVNVTAMEWIAPDLVDAVVRDDADPRTNSSALCEPKRDIHERIDVVVRVVDSRERRDRPQRCKAGLERVHFDRGEHLREGVTDLDRHQAPADLGPRAAYGKSDSHARRISRQAKDPGRQPGRAHRDGARINGQSARITQHAHRPENALDVRERLPHALEHDPVNALARPESGSNQPDLFDDLPALEVASESESSRCAECALEATSDLRAHAHAKPSRSLERDAHGFDPMAIPRGERQLHEGIDSAPFRGANLKRFKSRTCMDRLKRSAPDTLDGARSPRRADGGARGGLRSTPLVDCGARGGLRCTPLVDCGARGGLRSTPLVDPSSAMDGRDNLARLARRDAARERECIGRHGLKSQHDTAYHAACYCAFVFGLGFSELCVLLVVAVVVLGPKDLPRYLRQFGKMAGRVRSYAFELRAKSGIDELLRTEGLDRDIADIRKLARIARGEVDGVVGAVTLGPSPKRWKQAADAETVPYPESDAQPLPAGLLVDGDHEYPAIGPDAYGALPDEAPTDGELPASPLANDPVYAMGECVEARPAPTLPA